jgi:uncharacterized protein (TIGR02996 family)
MERIVAEPNEDTHRLVYADFLEENSAVCARELGIKASRCVEFAQFIRNQVNHGWGTPKNYYISRFPVGITWRSNSDGDLEESSMGIKLEFRRGFPNRISIPPSLWVDCGESVLKYWPISHVRATWCTPFYVGAPGIYVFARGGKSDFSVPECICKYMKPETDNESSLRYGRWEDAMNDLSKAMVIYAKTKVD